MNTNIEERAAQWRKTYGEIRQAVASAVIGHDAVVAGVINGLICGGHVLLEGLPGLGKTLLVRSLAQAVRCTFTRIQFTPDLMPADVTGTNVVMEEGGRRGFVFQKGPIFGNIVLADEINRATPKTQSALLEAMQESGVTVAGVTYTLEQPFFVLATQNPIEMEGTYPLPEAQLDRFLLKLEVGLSGVEELTRILDATTGTHQAAITPVTDGKGILALRELAAALPIAPHLLEYAARIVRATHADAEDAAPMAARYVRYGSSPRGGQALVRVAKVRALAAGRYNVSADDLRAVAADALRHRLILNFEGEAEGVTTTAVIKDALEHVEEIPEKIKRL